MGRIYTDHGTGIQGYYKVMNALIGFKHLDQTMAKNYKDAIT